jgi:hypothetical protein
MKLTNSQLTNFAKQVAKDVKNDGSRDSLKSKISRAANNIIQKMTGGKISSVQQDVLNILPDNIENKSESEISAETTNKLDTVRKHNPVRNFRGLLHTGYSNQYVPFSILKSLFLIPV